MNYALIFAGGLGTRMNTSIPKQFLLVDNKPIIIHTITHFDINPNIDGIVVVCNKDYIDLCKKYLIDFKIKKVIDVVSGGDTSQESIFNGLSYLYNYSNNKKDDIVLIHDGVRPNIDIELIDENITTVKQYGNCISAVPAIETIINSEHGKVNDIIDRSICMYARAPQSFYLNDIYEKHLLSKKDNISDSFIDCATLMHYYGVELHIAICSQDNIKITTISDYYMFKGIYENKHSII